MYPLQWLLICGYNRLRYLLFGISILSVISVQPVNYTSLIYATAILCAVRYLSL